MQVPNTPAGLVRYKGELRCGSEVVPVWLDIIDQEFVRLPRIILLKRPAILPAICSHIGSDNAICYASDRLTHIDIHNAAAQVLYCLDQAEMLLNQLATSDPRADTKDEFLSYWQGEPVLVDTSLRAERTRAWRVSLHGMPRWIVSPGTREDVEGRYGPAGVVLAEGMPAYILPASKPPVVSGDIWPPTTRHDLARWLHATDKEALRALEEKLRQFHKSRHERLLVVFTHDSAWFGFKTGFNKAFRSKHRTPKEWIHHVFWGQGSKAAIERVQPVRIDDAYVISRNLSGRRNLTGKKIVVAGCGAIGGYLAELLVRAGAGIGSGELVLVDPDRFMPGNLGRHILGVPDLFRPKAVALKEWIESRFPQSRIVAIKNDVRNISFRGVDLLIDATGEQALSAALNLRYLAGKLPGAVLYAWIAGPGTAAQCLLVDSPNYGCHRCLWTADGQERYSPLREPVDPVVMGHGCDDAFVPFSAAAAMQAASLAGQLALDWINATPSPRMRTRFVGYENRRDIKDDKDLTHTKGCPACGG
jgi:molybdopterin/thiamine biosynthesis adenylyltransferase